jgi:hypothetical protein
MEETAPDESGCRAEYILPVRHDAVGQIAGVEGAKRTEVRGFNLMEEQNGLYPTIRGGSPEH